MNQTMTNSGGHIAKKIIIMLIGFSAPISAVHAAPIDLSSWTALTLNFPGGQNAGNWELQPGNTEVIQTRNADPSFFLNNINQTSYSIEGTWEVLTSRDNDYMGFVFGYQNSSEFYLFDWKQGTQGLSGTTAAQGMTIKKFEGATGDGLTDLDLTELWENEFDFGDMTILAQNHGSTMGWADKTSYDFLLEFNTTAGEFRVEVSEGATTLWDQTVVDSTFTSGEFGFYNYSQGNVRYSGFEQTGGTPVPEAGATAMMLGLALIGLAAVRKRLVA